MSDRMIHKFAEGKYTVISEGGKLRAERHGTPWRSLTGDSLVLAMLQEVDDLKTKVEELQSLLEALTLPVHGLMPDIVERIRRTVPPVTHKSQGKTWEKVENVPTR